MVNRNTLFNFISENYHIKEDHPWDNLKGYAVFRHKDNDKWFCLIMDVTPDKIGQEGNELSLIHI